MLLTFIYFSSTFHFRFNIGNIAEFYGSTEGNSQVATSALNNFRYGTFILLVYWQGCGSGPFFAGSGNFSPDHYSDPTLAIKSFIVCGTQLPYRTVQHFYILQFQVNFINFLEK